jgi:hypothetical protein
MSRAAFTEWEIRAAGTYDPGVRPATAIVIVVLLAIIAVAGLIQLWLIFSPPS